MFTASNLKSTADMIREVQSARDSLAEVCRHVESSDEANVEELERIRTVHAFKLERFLSDQFDKYWVADPKIQYLNGAELPRKFHATDWVHVEGEEPRDTIDRCLALLVDRLQNPPGFGARLTTTLRDACGSAQIAARALRAALETRLRLAQHLATQKQINAITARNASPIVVEPQSEFMPTRTFGSVA